jgi:hypothetical protein
MTAGASISSKPADRDGAARGHEAIDVPGYGDGIARAVISQAPERETLGAAGAPSASLAEALFRNIYYDFPREGAGLKAASIFDAAFAAIAKVSQDFHDRVYVQGSGRIESGTIVSFAKRDCDCAAMCPRTGQKVCFERPECPGKQI